MNRIYDAELPYSDELAHYGIKGMHWYQRRFQNEDGSLTPAGRERYSKGGKKRESSNSVKSGSRKSGKEIVKAVGSATLHGAARAATRLGEGVARGVKTKLAEKMPFMLNDEELDKYRDRLKKENTFRSEIANRRDLKKKAQGDQFVKKLAQDTIKTVANKATNKLMDELLTTADERERDRLDIELKRQGLESAEIRNKNEARVNRVRGELDEDMRKQSDDKTDLEAIKREQANIDTKLKEAEKARDNAFARYHNSAVSSSTRERAAREWSEAVEQIRKYEERKDAYKNTADIINARISNRNERIEVRKTLLKTLTGQKEGNQSGNPNPNP